MPNLFEIVKAIDDIKAAGDKIQREFTPDWLIKTVASSAKKWFFESMLSQINYSRVGEDLQLTPEQTDKVLKSVFAEIRRNY